MVFIRKAFVLVLAVLVAVILPYSFAANKSSQERINNCVEKILQTEDLSKLENINALLQGHINNDIIQNALLIVRERKSHEKKPEKPVESVTGKREAEAGSSHVRPEQMLFKMMINNLKDFDAYLENSKLTNAELIEILKIREICQNNALLNMKKLLGMADEN